MLINEQSPYTFGFDGNFLRFMGDNFCLRRLFAN